MKGVDQILCLYGFRTLKNGPTMYFKSQYGIMMEEEACTDILSDADCGNLTLELMISK